MQSLVTNTGCVGPIYKPSFLGKSSSIEACVKERNEEDSNKLDVCELSRLTTCWIHKINFHIAHKEKSDMRTICVGEIK